MISLKIIIDDSDGQKAFENKAERPKFNISKESLDIENSDFSGIENDFFLNENFQSWNE